MQNLRRHCPRLPTTDDGIFPSGGDRPNCVECVFWEPWLPKEITANDFEPTVALSHAE